MWRQACTSGRPRERLGLSPQCPAFFLSRKIPPTPPLIRIWARRRQSHGRDRRRRLRLWPWEVKGNHPGNPGVGWRTCVLSRKTWSKGVGSETDGQ